MMTLRGVMHLHSSYSFDSKVPLERIVERAQKAGLAFVCPTEHTNDLDEKKFQDFLTACSRWSNAHGLLVVPGLEITCKNGLHLLAYGLSRLPRSRILETLLETEKQPGVLYVLAHPPEEILRTLNQPGKFPEGLSGMEVWNRKYHGLWSPHPEALRVLREARRARPGFYAYGGADHHDAEDLLAPVTVVQCKEKSVQSVLEALAAGSFKIHHGRLSLAPDGSLKGPAKALLQSRWAVRQALFRILKWAKKNLAGRILKTETAWKLEKKIRNQL